MEELTLTLFILSIVGGVAFLYIAIKTVHTSSEFGKMGKTLNVTTALARENTKRQENATIEMSEMLKEIESLKSRIEVLEGVKNGKQ